MLESLSTQATYTQPEPGIGLREEWIVGYVVDPEGNETAIIHDLVDFLNMDVLEVGCGDGRLTQRFAGSCRSVLAIDPVQSRIEQASASLPPALADIVTFRTADIVTAELPTAAFDIAVLSWSI